MRNVILNATFSDTKGATISYKDLKNNQKVYVAGTLEDTKELVNFLCTVEGTKLITKKGTYTFIPAEASSIKNCIDIKINFFKVEDEEFPIIIDTDLNNTINLIKEKLKATKIVQACGKIPTHYRLKIAKDDNVILTSSLVDIFKEGDNTYIKTKNSIYRIIS